VTFLLLTQIPSTYPTKEKYFKYDRAKMPAKLKAANEI
jgi:hypothetical protein